MTKLLFLSDTYLFISSGVVRESGNNENGQYIILEQTIFYPQGGGQPSDTGIISGVRGTFLVKSVRIDEGGIVYHYGEYESGIFEKDETVSLKIDGVKRIQNARNHSGGHLIDIAMQNIGLGYLQPTKGYHFPDGPYVEYSGNMIESIEDIIQKLQNAIDALIERNIKMIIEYATSVKSPEGKTPRYAHFEGYEGCGCGGTHVRSSGEIEQIYIRKIKMKDGKIRISYTTERG